MYVILRTGKTSGARSNPAEIGTLLLEFGTLSKLTRNPVFYDKAKNALVELYKRRSKIGLVGEEIDVETGQWTSRASHVGGGIDSYYEYLLKCSKLFGDRDCADMWKQSRRAMNRYLADDAPTGLWYGQADMGPAGARRPSRRPARLPPRRPDARRRPRPGEAPPGFGLQNVEPVRNRARGDRLPDDEGALPRLSPAAGDRGVGLLPLPLHPRSEVPGDGPRLLRGPGRALPDGRRLHRPQERRHPGEGGPDAQPFLAETLKYLDLLFAPEKTLDLDRVVFNTEAHPLRRTW